MSDITRHERSFITRRKHDLQRRLLATSVGTAVLMGISLPTAQAADASSSESVLLPEISIQGQGSSQQVGDYYQDKLGGTKFTAPVSKTPKTIQVIDKSVISDQRATTLTEALKNSPGVGTFFVGENGNTATGDSVYMRGFDSSGSIFVDGVRDLGTVSRDTFNTEQVEVIKGPDGADYGRTAPSGSINMVSKQAHKGDSNELNVSGGSADQKRVTLDMNRQINDTSAARLNLMGQDSGVPGRDEVNNKRWGVAPAVSFGLGTDKRLKLDYLHVTQDNIPDGGASTIGMPGYSAPKAGSAPPDPQFDNAPQPDSENFYGTHADYEDVTMDMFTVLFEQDLGDKTFHTTTRWGRTHQDYLLSAFMASSSAIPTGPWDMTDLRNWQMSRTLNALDQTNTILTNQSGIVQLLKTGSVEHMLSYGLEFAREEVENNGVGAPIDPLTGKPMAFYVNVYNPGHVDPAYRAVRTGADSKGRVDTAAIYLFDDIQLTEEWKLLAGLRLDHYKAVFDTIATTCGGRGQPGCASGHYEVGPEQTLTASDNLFTWQLGTLYQLTPALNVYADYAVAAQPPGGDALKLSSGASSVNNPNFDPQKAKTMEVGSKWKLAQGKLLLATAVYRTDLSNQVESDGGSPAQYFQTGRKRVQGVEISAVGQITPNWNISTGFTTMQARILSGAAQAQDKSSDLSYNPTRAFTSWTTYKLPFGLIVGGGVRYNGKLKKGQDGAVGTPAYVKSYWVADAMASYALAKNLDLQLNVYNLFDKEYAAAINKSGYRYTPGQPLSAVLSMNLKF